MIRKAQQQELPQIMTIYENARSFMAKNGNPGQWQNGYPSENLLKNDLKQEQLYVYEDEKGIGAVFVYFIGDEPTYHEINGAWLNEKPYGVLHRIAVARYGEGIASKCLAWCLTQCGNMRGDTHADNASMQRLFNKNGFARCGIIHVEDGTERIAFQKDVTAEI
jgi:GNAT superfamily N-acetyltransferase